MLMNISENIKIPFFFDHHWHKLNPPAYDTALLFSLIRFFQFKINSRFFHIQSNVRHFYPLKIMNHRMDMELAIVFFNEKYRSFAKTSLNWLSGSRE